MPYSKVTGRYDQSDSDDFPRSLSWNQRSVLYVAAIYKLHHSSMGWWVDRYECVYGLHRVHSATVKSLLKRGLLEGNARGENIALGGWDGKSTMEPPILWTSAKGKKLLDKITRGLASYSRILIVSEKEHYRIIAQSLIGSSRHEAPQ